MQERVRVTAVVVAGLCFAATTVLAQVPGLTKDPSSANRPRAVR
jgi:hypothetical protein